MFATKDRSPQDLAASRPLTFAVPVPISTNPRQESQVRPFIFNGLRTLLPAQKFQPLHFHSLPHSLRQERNITPAFPITPALSLRSCASVQVSTPLLSGACALFVKNTGEGVHPPATQLEPLREILSPQSRRVWAVLAAHVKNVWAVLAAHANYGDRRNQTTFAGDKYQGGIVDLRKVLSELKQERDRLSRAIAALEGIEGVPAVATKVFSTKPAPKTAKKHKLTPEGRKRLSEMMKKRWAERRRKLAGNHRQAKAA
jgi:hypothetical protein